MDVRELRIRQLQFARELRDEARITTVSNEVRRLGPTP
jgi:hypothetical protein